MTDATKCRAQSKRLVCRGGTAYFVRGSLRVFNAYAFASTHPDHTGLLKVGYTERNAPDE